MNVKIVNMNSSLLKDSHQLERNLLKEIANQNETIGKNEINYNRSHSGISITNTHIYNIEYNVNHQVLPVAERMDTKKIESPKLEKVYWVAGIVVGMSALITLIYQCMKHVSFQ
ncbi:MAG: hypothetical protein JWQ57_4285 [Mucilaginibacter sp.]|nr:hypothetical protein [Mucilaginibacter sp.]